MTERSSGTRYSRKNSGGTPPSKPYPPQSATPRQRKQSFQMSSDKANSPSHVSDPQTEEAKLPNVVRPPKKNSLSQSPKKEGPAMITIKFNGKPTFLTTHNYNPIHVVVELNEVIIPKDSYPTTTLSPDDTLEILTFMGGGQ